MKKIIELGPEQFLTGISPNPQAQNQGIWSEMQDVSVALRPLVGSTTLGILRGSNTPTSVATLSDVPFAYAKDLTGSNDKVYYLGDAGHLYEHDLSTATVTDKRSATPITGPANGLALFQPRSGTKYLYYWQATQIGRWNLSGAYPAGWTDNWVTGLTSTTWHPTHQLFDRLYYGNFNYIGYIEDNGAAAETHVATALDIPVDFRVNCLSDDGQYLVAGLSNNTSTTINNIGSSKVIFWDGNQSSWQREWPIPEAAILSIKRVGGLMYAVCYSGIYAFTFSEPPQLVLGPFSSAQLPDYDIPSQGAAAVLGDALLWASGNSAATKGDISSFGKLSSQTPSAYLRPFGGFPLKPVLIMPDIEVTNIYAACRSTNTLYTILRMSSGTALTGSTSYAKTIYLDLKRFWQVGRMVVNFEIPLTSSDQASFSLSSTINNTYAVGTVTGSTAGTIRNKEFYISYEADKIAITCTLLAGAPLIKSIELWGDPITTPTHART